MNLGRYYGPAFALLGILSLGACSTIDGVFDIAKPTPTRTPNEVAREIEVPEAPMDFALFEAYMDLAEARYYAGEENDFEFFADRAIAVASGEDVSPATIDPNLMTPQQAEQVKRERQQLIDAQTEALERAYNPDRATLLKQAARAQVMFDCRIRQIYADRASQEVAVCGERFSTSLAALESSLDSGIGVTEGTSTFVLYFDKNSTELDIVARAVIAEAEAAARKLKGARMIVLGGTNGRVSATANALAALRAETVARRLESGGLPVKIDSYGAQARVYNAGGEDPEDNRRVEIRIEQ